MKKLETDDDLSIILKTQLPRQEPENQKWK